MREKIGVTLAQVAPESGAVKRGTTESGVVKSRFNGVRL